jgi:DNA adenine methylase
MVQPILKWAGGKRQILHEIRACLPPEGLCKRYHEPFFGGGALFFDTAPHPNGSSINDVNPRLMNFYRVVRDEPEELIKELKKFRSPEAPPDESEEFNETNRKGKEIENYYYQQRELFNNRPNGDEFDKIREAARLLYLNRTCYNGLYRENQSGEFNVPIGSHSSPNWKQTTRIIHASEVLQGVEIENEDFEYVRDLAKEGDLVYCDPPYRPVSRTSSFVEYSSDSFGPDQQKRLRDMVVNLHERGVYVVVSNSPPIRELYNSYDGLMIHDIGAKRHINSNGEDRGEVGEIIVTNVPEDNRREKTVKLDQFTQESSTT